MKKIIFCLCALVLSALVCSSCQKKGADGSASVAAGDNSLQKVLDAKKFVLGLDDSFPPMGYRNDFNEIVGYDIDLAREVARRIGVELVTQPINWDAKEQELNTGEIDCIWNGFTITEERKKVILYTPPYLKNAQVIVVKNGSPVQTLSDLAGKTIATQAGSSSVDALDDAPDFKKSLKEVIELKDFLTALMELDVGSVDAVLIDLVVANDNIRRSGKPFRMLTENLGEEEFGIGFRKNDAALCQKVWSVLLEMVKDGDVAQISEKWLGADISTIGK
jgi:polar amino acid transport system substrate-binding protein